MEFLLHLGIDVFFPACKGLGERTHHFTLLDGEMIIDTLPESQKQERRYLIYDMMALNKESVVEVSSSISQLHYYNYYVQA